MEKIKRLHKCRDGETRTVEVKPTTKYCPVCNGRFDYKGRPSRDEQIKKIIDLLNMTPKTRRSVESVAVGMNISITTAREFLRIMEAKNLIYTETARQSRKKYYHPKKKLTEAEKKQIEKEAKKEFKGQVIK